MPFVRFTARSLGLLMALAIIAAGCAKKESSTSQTDTGADTTTQAMTPAGPSDAEIAAIVVDYDSVEVMLAQVAQKMSKNAKVKEFAKLMITDHTGVTKQAVDLATRLNLTPAESDISRKLTSDGMTFHQSLAAMSGADFNRAYIANEVALHQAVLDMMDNTLIPSAQNPDLKALLNQVRPAVAAHLEHAKQVQTALTTS